MKRTGATAVVFGLLFLGVSCRQPEKLFDDTRSFAALGGGTAFSLAAVPLTVKAVVVNFFAPDCPPCEKEIPALKAFYEAHKQDTAVSFISIGSSLRAVGANAAAAPGRDEINKELEVFIRRFAVNYPQHTADAADLVSWRVTGFPETFIFARTPAGFKLKRKFISEITRESLENELSRIGH